MNTRTYHLRRRLIAAALALLIAGMAATAATFAWYIYNTGVHTTNVRMAAGTGVSLQIASEYDGAYSSAAVLDSFIGALTPVSTDRILGGFQEVQAFTTVVEENRSRRVASIFRSAEQTDYYQTTLYLRTNGAEVPVYLSDIGYEDSDEDNPISTAIRIGFVVHQSGRGGAVREEYIFAINNAENPKKNYNTATGEEGYVLDSSKTDGTTVPFTPYTSDNYCLYDRETGETALKAESVPLMYLTGRDGEYGDSTQVDIYIWLEGCDEDCANNLCSTTLKNLSLSFSALS